MTSSDDATCHLRPATRLRPGPTRAAYAAIAADDPRIQHLRRVTAARDQARRALYALTKGIPQLEHAAEVCGRMDMRSPREAVLEVRSEVFQGKYDGLPLTRIEGAMAQKGVGAMVMLVAYQAVASVIEEDLSRGEKDSRTGN